MRVKKLAKKTKRAKHKRTKQKKTNRHNLYLGIVALIIVISLFVYYFNFIQGQQYYYDNEQKEIPGTTTITEEQRKMTTGGFCKKNSECFLTYCKGKTENCINTTQLSVYSRNCKSYSDWVLEEQDFSRCACVQNACALLE